MKSTPDAAWTVLQQTHLAPSDLMITTLISLKAVIAMWRGRGASLHQNPDVD